MDKVRNEKIVYVIGCPGSGKGTLCSKLTQTTTFRHLSVGDLLRQQDRNGSITDPQIQDCLLAGKLVPVEFLSRLLESSLPDCEHESYNVVLLDGFPRRLDQIHPIQKVIGRPRAVLFFDCPREIARQRVLHRLLPGRDRDGAVFEDRYAEFCLNNPDIVNYYQAEQLLIKVDTSGPTPVSYELLVRAMRKSGLLDDEALRAIVSA